uniref:Uncharacterized protein n=1 Tax=Timema bartmani TaxID=61472 RepID=A0A7R9I093_9NEOP|nr:unnamed protein product [Timema bartmani]
MFAPRLTLYSIGIIISSGKDNSAAATAVGAISEAPDVASPSSNNEWPISGKLPAGSILNRPQGIDRHLPKVTSADHQVLLNTFVEPFEAFSSHAEDIVDVYTSVLASVVLTDSSQLTFDDFEKLPDQIMYPYAEPYDLQKTCVVFTLSDNQFLTTDLY